MQNHCPRPVETIAVSTIIATFIAVVGGWWCFPWGPIRLIQSFVENASGKSVTVEQLINGAVTL